MGFYRPPNETKLSGERKRVRCSAPLGDARCIRPARRTVPPTVGPYEPGRRCWSRGPGVPRGRRDVRAGVTLWGSEGSPVGKASGRWWRRSPE